MRIFSSLVEIALLRKEEFNFEDLSFNRDEILKLWREELPPPAPLEKSLCGVDGSRNKKSFAGYVIYAAGACSVELSPKEGLCGETFLAELDILKPDEYSDARLRILMGILEAKLALKAAREGKTVLIDGSLAGAVLRPSVFVYEVSEESKKVAGELLKELKRDFSLSGIDSKKFYPLIEREFSQELPVLAGYLEYLEYLYSLKLLFEEGEGRVISISKRSSSRNYGFDSVLPDITVLYLAKVPRGYSEPVEISLAEKKFAFPREFEEFFKEKRLKSFFFRIKDGIFKCETQMEAEEALSIITASEVGGYPLPLKEAHSRVKITRKDMEIILKELRHRGATGREALGEE